MGTNQNFLNTLFLGGGGATCLLEMQLVLRRKQPFLVLPCNRQMAAHVLALYPAQTVFSRMARTIFRCVLRLNLLRKSRTIKIPFSPEAPFVRFLSKQTISEGKPPPFGILAGNPNSPGQRLIFLILDANGNPKTVVKAGTTDFAKKLIAHEKQFLQSAPNFSGIPRLRGVFASSEIDALAMDFISGEPLRSSEQKHLPEFLSAWVNSKKQIAIGQTDLWLRLKERCGRHSIFQRLAEMMECRLVCSTIYHGDFAPWNIKTCPDGSWMALDWERGELEGIPGWDWFHYVVQTDILVGKKSVAAIVKRLETLLGSSEFGKYSQLAGIAGTEQASVLAYLLDQYEIIMPSEGAECGRELISTLADRWLKI